MVTETFAKSDCTDPWELLRKVRRRNLYIKGIYLVLAVILMTTDISQNGRLERSYLKQIEYTRQIATLVAENRRLRGNCPTGPTPSGSLANR